MVPSDLFSSSFNYPLANCRTKNSAAQQRGQAPLPLSLQWYLPGVTTAFSVHYRKTPSTKCITVATFAGSSFSKRWHKNTSLLGEGILLSHLQEDIGRRSALSLHANIATGSSWILAFGVDSTTAKYTRAYQARNVLLRAVRQAESCGNLSLKQRCSFEVAQHPGCFSGGSPWCRIWV